MLHKLLSDVEKNLDARRYYMSLLNGLISNVIQKLAQKLHERSSDTSEEAIEQNNYGAIFVTSLISLAAAMFSEEPISYVLDLRDRLQNTFPQCTNIIFAAR